MKDLKKQADDTDLMIERMDEEVKKLTSSYRSELNQIEVTLSSMVHSVPTEHEIDIDVLIEGMDDEMKDLTRSFYSDMIWFEVMLLCHYSYSFCIIPWALVIMVLLVWKWF